MSKEVNKRVNVWINGKEVENNVKSIRAAMVQLTNQLNKMDIGSAEYIETSKKLRDLKAIYDEHCKSLKMTNQGIENNTTSWKKNIIHWGAFAAAAQGASAAIQRFVSATQEYVDAYATLDDAMSAVQKTTGMTREEVEGLHKSLKSIDTRTSTNELLKISEIGGRMGIAKDQIQGFTEAVNKANVALGDSFQGGAEEISSILGKISLAYKETRSQDIGKSLTQIGSALNEVGASANATEGNIAAFVQRVGSMPEVFRPTVQQAVALGAAFEESSIDAEVASRAFGIFMMKASTNVEKFATAMHRPIEEVRELINTNPAQFFVEFAESLKGLNATEEGSVLKDLKLNADGVNKIIGAMSTNTERFTEILNTSNTAFAEAVSLDKEYAVVNENAAAQLEKAKKAVEDAKAELGEKLIPVLTAVTNGTSGFIRALTKLPKTVGDNKAMLVVLATLLSKQILLLVKSTAALTKKTLAIVKDTVVQRTNTVITNLSTLRLYAHGLAHDIAAGKIRLHIAAQEALSMVMKKTPWGFVIGMIATTVAAVKMFTAKQREAKKATEEFNKACAREQAEAEYLFGKLKKAKRGTKDYEEALQKLKEKYPEIIQKHIDEEGKLRNIEQAYKDVITQIQAKIALDMREQAVSETLTTKLNKYSKFLGKLREEAKAQGLSESATEDIVNTVRFRVDELIDAGKNAQEVASVVSKEVNDLGLDIHKAERSFAGAGATAWALIMNMANAGVKARGTLDDVSKQFNPFIDHLVKSEDELDEIAQIDAQIAELQKQIYGAENKNEIRQQIEDLKKLKQQKLENKKVDGSGSVGQSEDEDPTEAERRRKKLIEDRKSFEKKLAQMRTKEQTDLLTGWKKTKQQIIDKYKEMEDEAIRLYGENSQMLEDVQVQRDQAIVESGQKYVQDMAKVISKSADEIKKWEKELGKDGSNEIIDAVLGVKDKWEQRAADVEKTLKDLESTREVMSEDKMDTTAIDKQIADLKRYREDIMNLSVQEISKTYQKYEKQTADFITAESKAAREATMTEVEKQKAAIQERYQQEIDNINKLIAAKLQNEVVDEAEIQSLRDKIELLKKMQAEAEAAVVKQASDGLRGKSIWQQLAEFDWSRLSDNWQQGLALMTNALDEFASSAMSIFNTINQMQSNREQAEFDSYCKMQDDKAKNLQDRLDKGLISQEKYDAEIAKMEEEKEAKEKQMKHEQFERERQSSLAEVLIQGGIAVARAFADYGWPWGLIPAALSTAQTAVQTAMIASQVNPYARGGYIDREQLALMGEEGQEWVASNRLLTDKKTAPVISALERYQRGDIRALEMLRVPEPSWEKLSQSSRKLSRTFALSTPVNNYYYTNSNNTTTSDNSELLAVMKRMDAYLRDPKNRQAVISRKMQLEFDRMETEIKQLARL